MKNKIIDRLKNVGRGYELDKLPTGLMKAVLEAAASLIEIEIQKAEDRAIQKVINEKFVARVIKETLEGKTVKTSSKRTPKNIEA